MVTDGNQAYCGDRFAVHTNTESLCCIPETNITCQSYLKKKEGKKERGERRARKTISWSRDWLHRIREVVLS